MCCLPAFLVWRGVPGPAEVVLAVCLAAPIVASFALSVGWSRAAGHVLSAAGGAGIVGAFLAGAGPAGWPALLLLAAEPLDALRSRSRDGALAALAVAALAAVTVLAPNLATKDTGEAGQVCLAVLAVGWLAYGTVLAARACRARRLPARDSTADMPAPTLRGLGSAPAEETRPAVMEPPVLPAAPTAVPVRPVLVEAASLAAIPLVRPARPALVGGAGPAGARSGVDAPVALPMSSPPRFRMIA